MKYSQKQSVNNYLRAHRNLLNELLRATLFLKPIALKRVSLLTLVAVVFLLFFSQTANASTYYISPSGSNSANGDITHPWLSLSYACAHATTSGDIIHITAGTYTETTASSLALGVSIIGEGDVSHIISTYNGTGHHAAIELLSSTDATNGNQSISYIKLDGNNGIGYNGIFVRQRKNVVIHQCTIIGFDHNGVSLLGANAEYTKPAIYPTGNQLYNCTVQDCEDLIMLMGQQDVLIHDNILDNRTDVSRITRIIDAGTSYNKGTKLYNNKCYKPDDTGDIWNFMVEHWDGEGGIEVYGNEFYGSDCVFDVGGNYNIKGSYAYSWSIHDNLFTTLSGNNEPLTPHGKTCITIEGQTLEYIQIYNNHFDKLLKPIGSSEGGEPAGTFNHIYIHNNLMTNCGTGVNGSYSNPVLNLTQYLSGSTMSDIYINNNVITSDGITNLGGIWVKSANGSNINIKNNILVGFQNWGAIWLTNDGTINNIHVDYNCFYNNVASIDLGGNAMTNYTTVSNVNNNPGFASPTDFHLATGSPCIDAGIDVGLTLDYEGNPIPYNLIPDRGAYEHTSGTGNQAPIIQNQAFSLNENSTNGTIVGTIVASDPNAGQTLTYSILSGNTSSAFSINASTGILTVANSAALNFEVTPSFALVVKVQDNGTGTLSSQAIVTISLTNVNEVPVINNQSFSVAENSTNGTTVGTVVASDPDAGQTKIFSILSGNTSGAFAINASTGVLTVANSVALNFITNPSFSLIVKVTDNGTGNLSSQATITVNVLQLTNQAPQISNQSFSINENSANGTTVGTVIASDPNAGQTITFSILSGNTGGAFIINTLTGVLTVANSASLNFEVNPSFALIVKVLDNGTGVLSSQATVTVSLTNVNEVPVVNNQIFSVAENSANGTTVGTVIATDPDAGQTKTFSILSGNTSGAFAINASTGVLTVANSVALNFITNPSFSLIVKVTDNGTGNLSSQATIAVNVLQGTNQAPQISNQSFSINENSANGTTVGTVIASDPNAGQTITFSILSGNTGGAFTINTLTGVLTVANSASLNFEVTPSFALIVKVLDNGTGVLSSQATVTVSLTNVNEVPVVNNQIFSVAENSANGTTVGTVIATDPDAGQTKTFSILSGNTSGAFAINSSTGVLTVANSAALNIQLTLAFALVVKVQDNGAGNLSSQATVTINLNNVSTCSATGFISYQVWNNIGSSNLVSSLTSNVNFPDSPSTSTLISSMEGASDQADNYGARIAGYICAPATGAYTFWIASDDNGELWLSTDNQPAHSQKIAYHTDWTASREWNKYSTQKSATINLIQGQTYYIEAMMKEGGGGDNLAVGWLKPGQSGSVPSEVIPGNVLSPINASSPILVSSVSLPATTTVAPGAFVTLVATVLATNSTNKNLNWTSANSSVATVDNSGMVTAFSPGNAIITATSTDGSNKSGSCSLSVSGPSCTATGYISYQVWNNIGSSTLVSSLTSNTNYPNNPNTSTLITSMEGVTDQADNYGARIAGYICAPITGAYTFWIASDDNGELWLSTDDQPAHSQKIAYHTNWTASREWNKFSTQKSASITLLQGHTYYIEALMKEGGGGDNLAVGWLKPGQTGTVPSEVIPGNVLSPLNTSSTILVSSVSLPATASVTQGTLMTMVATVLPTNATNNALNWTSSNSSVATVDNSGLVTGMSPGNTVITITSTDGSNKSGTCTLTVNSPACTATGNIAYQKWNNIGSSSAIVALTSNSNYPNNPSSSILITSMEAQSNVGNKYGARIAGFICAPATGNYTFWIASADNGELWLSTNNLPANKQKIAFHTGSTNPRQWNKYSTQKSAVIYLIQGQSYYIEALMKESSGSDNLAVGWLKPGQTGTSPSEVIPGSVLSPMDGFVFKELSAEDIATEMSDSISSIDLVPDNVTIYPNPVTNKTLNVQLEGSIREDFNLSVYDMTGRSLIEKHFEQQSKVAIDVSAFPMGVYMLVVRNNNLKFSKKFIVN